MNSPRNCAAAGAVAKERQVSIRRPTAVSRHERALFFGRERERAELRDLILTYRVVLLYAQSGAGKRRW